MERKSVFESASLMAVFGIAALVCCCALAVVFFLLDGKPDLQHVIYLMIGILSFFLYRAYKKHDKNVMKGLLGATLTALLINEFAYIYLVYYQKCVDMFIVNTTVGVLSVVIEAILLGAMVAFFINHFIINGDHHSSPANVRFNQVALWVIFIAIIVQEVFSICTLGEYPPLLLVAQILWFFSEISAFGVIVCVETKLDNYRILREQK